MMSSTDGAFGLDGTSRAGAELRAARQARGWSLRDVSATLRLREAYLDAIENGRFQDLPAPAYAQGFVRSYAKLLDMDADAVAQAFRAENPDHGRAPQLAFPAPLRDRGVPAGAMILMGGVVSLFAYIGWYQSMAHGSQAQDRVAAVPARLASLADAPPQPTNVSPQVASVLPQPPRADIPAVPESAPFYPPSQAAAAVLPPLPMHEVGQVVLLAKADCWVQVRDRQTGNVTMTRMLRAGERWPVPQDQALLLTTGNAGVTELLVDGASTGPLGAQGVVRRAVPMDPDGVRRLVAGKQVQSDPALPISNSTGQAVSQ